MKTEAPILGLQVIVPWRTTYLCKIYFGSCLLEVIYARYKLFFKIKP